MIEDGKLKCGAKTGGLVPLWPGENAAKFDAGVLKASLPDNQGVLQAITISNKATPPAELAINVDPAEADKPEVGKYAQMLAKSEDDDDKRNKWIVTKHHIDKKDWFTLKNVAYGYFLTCPSKEGQTNQIKQLIVSYEVPGIQLTSFLSR